MHLSGEASQFEEVFLQLEEESVACVTVPDTQRLILFFEPDELCLLFLAVFFNRVIRERWSRSTYPFEDVLYDFLAEPLDMDVSDLCIEVIAP